MKGKTFLPVPSAGSEHSVHLYVIVSEPDIDKNVMVVNITSFYGTGREDESCILESNDHPFIKHRSYVAYNRASEINCLKLLSDNFKQKIIFKEDIKPTVLKRIQDGARKSKRLPILFRKYFDHF